MNFDAWLVDTLPFNKSRAKEILTSAGFIPGISWDGKPTNSEMLSIKLPSEGYMELQFDNCYNGLWALRSIELYGRDGKHTLGLTSEFNIARQVIAYALGWPKEKIDKHAFWYREEDVTQADFAFLWQGAVTFRKCWFDMTSRYLPTKERIEATENFFREAINNEPSKNHS